MNSSFDGLVIGTAGHIDHGKSALVQALTGIDTDRLAEEKRRGISIDLGFAHAKLSSGATISFVDVPGHERFVKNMLAGASGMHAVMLIVAADEGVMPQTREHFEICRLLGMAAGFVVLTKADLADPEQLESTRRQVIDLCKGSFLEGAPILPVSSVRKTGLGAVTEQLERLAGRVASQAGERVARLPVDRSFSLKGFGTVVTGTLIGGRLRVGDTLILQPAGEALRVRGLQLHGEITNLAEAGQRVAVNLAGVESGQIVRGNVLTSSALLATSRWLAVTLDWLAGHPLPTPREQMLAYIGTAEVGVSVKLLSSTPMLARLWLSDPVLVLPGDRFILRRPSPSNTVAGGTVVDAFAPLRLRSARALDRLQRLSCGTSPERVDLLVKESAAGLTLQELVRLSGLTAEALTRLVETNDSLLLDETSQRVISREWLARQRQKLVQWLLRFHAEDPAKAGAPLAAARLGLSAEIAALVLDDFPEVRVTADLVSLASHRPRFNDKELRLLGEIEMAFRTGGYMPPSGSDVLKGAAGDPARARALLEELVKANRLIRISSDVLFHSDVIAHIRTSLAQHRGRRFSIPEFKAWTQISRKYAIPLLEYLDHQRVTRRDGDHRVVL